METYQGDKYWRTRNHYAYYKQVREWLNETVPGGSLCDVGGHDTPVSGWGDFDDRKNINMTVIENKLPHVEYVVSDFMDEKIKDQFDVITCLQVLEHLDDATVGKFAKKLLSLSKVCTIISVPHLWKKGSIEGHLQDPIDRNKFVGWVGREPDDFVVVKEEKEGSRIVARFFKAD